MKRPLQYILPILLFICLTAFGAHKFYVSIYQIDYAPQKKMLQITSRVFIDDLNDAIQKKYKVKTNLGEKNESPEDVALMKKYFLENCTIKVNGQSKPINYVSHEIENNVVICYFTIKNTTKVKTVEIRNTVLFDLFPDQQNIIQVNVLGKKQSLLLTNDNQSGVLKFG